MSRAKSARCLSKDTTKVAAIALDDRNRLVGVGVNGYPPQYDDENMSDKYDKVIHAEINAILNSRTRAGEIKTMFISGLPPCNECVKFMVAYGIKKVYANIDTKIDSAQKWLDLFKDCYHLHKNYIAIDLMIDEVNTQ